MSSSWKSRYVRFLVALSVVAVIGSALPMDGGIASAARQVGDNGCPGTDGGSSHGLRGTTGQTAIGILVGGSLLLQILEAAGVTDVLSDEPAVTDSGSPRQGISMQIAQGDTAGAEEGKVSAKP